MLLMFKGNFCPITWRRLLGARSFPGLVALPEKVPTKKAKYQPQMAEEGNNVAQRVSPGYASVVDCFNPGKPAPSYLPDAPIISTKHSECAASSIVDLLKKCEYPVICGERGTSLTDQHHFSTRSARNGRAFDPTPLFLPYHGYVVFIPISGH
jgi:hypothetical protein